MGKKIIMVLCIALVMGLSVFAAGQQEEAALTIGFVPKAFNSPYWITMDEAIKEVASEKGIEIISQAPKAETDVSQQVEIIENLIIRGVDALLIAPAGSKELVSVVGKANKAGIPVVIVDTRLDDEAVEAQGVEYVSFVGSDNYDGGKIAAEFMLEKLGSAKVAVLEGIAGHESSDARVGGFTDRVAGTGLEIVTSQTAQWERSKGFDVFQNMLTAHPEIEALFSANDEMALGAYQAIAQAGREDIVIVGFDANDDAKQAIKEGKMLGSIAQYPGDMGVMALETALAVLDGKSVERYIKSTLNVVTKDMLE